MAENEGAACMKINYNLIPSKVGCFLSSAYMGSFVAFLNVFFISVGMSEVRAGLLTAMMYTPCVITGPVWGYLADYTKRRTIILTTLCIGAAVSMFSLPWAAQRIYPLSQFQCNGTRQINGTSFHGVNTTIDGGSAASRCRKEKKDAQDTLFGVLFAIITVSALFVFPLMSYFEAIVANVAKTYGGSFGAQRLFGEIGISVSSYATAEACDHYRLKDMSEYSPAFFIFPAICIVMIPVGCHLLGQGDYMESDQSDHEPSSRLESNGVSITSSNEPVESINQSTELQPVKDVEMPLDIVARPENPIQAPTENATSLITKTLKLCSQVEVLLFLITVFIGGIANSLYLNFTLKYLVQTMGRTKAEGTYVIICTAVSSVITFPLTAKFIRLFGGTIAAITVALFAMCVRLLVVSFDIPFEAFVGVHLLNGFAFGLFYSSTMEHVLDIAPKEINMTMNHITLSLFFYVSALVGNIGGSEVFEKYGGAKLFLGQSLICGVWAAILFIHFARKKVCNVQQGIE